MPEGFAVDAERFGDGAGAHASEEEFDGAALNVGEVVLGVDVPECNQISR